jgi:single-strand DNA-binding protein
VLFGKIAQNLANYLKKGKQVFVEGRINNRSYDKQDGTKGYITDIIANNVVLLGAKNKNDEPETSNDNEPVIDVQEDDIPF